MIAKIGYPAPDLKISGWVQGQGKNIGAERGTVVFITVFQINCIGSFLHGIPAANNIYNKYQGQGLSVFGFATAFGQYDINTLQNLKLLLSTGELQGAPLNIVGEELDNEGGKLPFKINFPVAMDLLVKQEATIDDEKIEAIAVAKIPNYEYFHLNHKSIIKKEIVRRQLNRHFFAETILEYGLEGTPSSILIDKKGVLRHVTLGYDNLLEEKIQKLLAE